MYCRRARSSACGCDVLKMLILFRRFRKLRMVPLISLCRCSGWSPYCFYISISVRCSILTHTQCLLRYRGPLVRSAKRRLGIGWSWPHCRSQMRGKSLIGRTRGRASQSNCHPSTWIANDMMKQYYRWEKSRVQQAVADYVSAKEPHQVVLSSQKPGKQVSILCEVERC
jgi:hypothetical protein